MKFTDYAHDIYLSANRRALCWLLDRMDATHPLINTKLNSLSLQDYGSDDGLRGPDFVYGWIQGRGLEALILHARYFAAIDTQLSHRLYSAAESLYPFLHKLVATREGAFFCYDATLQPVRHDHPDGQTRQRREPDIATYSDLFCVKGLIAASAQFAPEHLPLHLSTLQAIIDAIDRDRFLMCETGDLTEAALTEQRPDFGPRMIALGAAALLHHLGLADQDSFSDRFIEHILVQHLDNPSALLANEPGGKLCNVGHGIEFAGFALDTYQKTLDGDMATRLGNIISTSFQAGFNGIGIVTLIDLTTKEAVNSVCPWWSLPETIRAASLAYEVTGNPALLDIWKTAHSAFFTNYWRDEPPIAYQSLTREGPIDIVPATPDLDPGYHTGLSLLGAMQMAERQ
ncbi:MAG: hypothetical protein HKN42_00335 [Granulosicoccus sp.]|nr:hypothetical protein [Granulosicoccus sp.]